eukprot:COSAG06_NODE_54_length_27948_cov_234.398671_3_plen_52_part_00
MGMLAVVGNRKYTRLQDGGVACSLLKTNSIGLSLTHLYAATAPQARRVAAI